MQEQSLNGAGVDEEEDVDETVVIVVGLVAGHVAECMNTGAHSFVAIEYTHTSFSSAESEEAIDRAAFSHGFIHRPPKMYISPSCVMHDTWPVRLIGRFNC